MKLVAATFRDQGDLRRRSDVHHRRWGCWWLRGTLGSRPVYTAICW
jgi:hypothetical protein